jgi:hypothetical protein
MNDNFVQQAQCIIAEICCFVGNRNSSARHWPTRNVCHHTSIKMAINKSGRVVNIPASHSGSSRVQNSARRPASLTEFFHGFPQTLQANAGIVPKSMPQSLPSKPSPIYYLLIVPSFDAIYSSLLKKRCEINYE